MPRFAGSIYDGFSPRGQGALGQLRVAFQQAGFYAEKERRTERTLRIYPERRWRYPLLNPGIVASQHDARISVTKPTIVCPIYSDGDALISRLLEAFPAIDGCDYVPARPRWSGRYFLHCYVLMPLAFVGERRAQIIDFAALRPALAQLQLFLSRSTLA